jgi:hypothetical protein
MPLTEDHLLLIKKQSSGTEYRQILTELRHRGIDAERQRTMWAEITEAIIKDVKTPSESTISKLLDKRRK